VTDHDTSDLGADPSASVGRALEEQGVTVNDGRRGCQGLAFVLQACPMREARLLSFADHAPAPGVETVVERPPAGIARGLLPVPPAAVVILTVALVLVTLGYYTLRLRGARRG